MSRENVELVRRGYELFARVVVAVRLSGRGRESGVELEMHVAHLWTVRDGKVVRGDVYRTADEALEAAWETG